MPTQMWINVSSVFTAMENMAQPYQLKSKSSHSKVPHTMISPPTTSTNLRPDLPSCPQSSMQQWPGSVKRVLQQPCYQIYKSGKRLLKIALKLQKQSQRFGLNHFSRYGIKCTGMFRLIQSDWALKELDVFIGVTGYKTLLHSSVT